MCIYIYIYSCVYTSIYYVYIYIYMHICKTYDMLYQTGVYHTTTGGAHTYKQITMYIYRERERDLDLIAQCVILLLQ